MRMNQLHRYFNSKNARVSIIDTPTETNGQRNNFYATKICNNSICVCC